VAWLLGLKIRLCKDTPWRIGATGNREQIMNTTIP
jgi:hypothetical protein